MQNTPLALDSIVKHLRSGNLVAFPTDTVFGLAADPQNKAAINKIFDLKQRDNNLRLALLAATIEDIVSVAVLDERTRAIAQAFWPGALTLVLPFKPHGPISDLVIGTQNTIAFRIPHHDIALSVLQAYGRPLAVTSVNISGTPPLLDSRIIREKFSSSISYVADGTCATHANSSTVLDLTGPEISVLRQGDITEADIKDLFS